MNKTLLIVFLAFFSTEAFAQLETSADFKRQVFKKEYTIGIVGHTRGYALSGRYLSFIDGFHKQGLEIDISKLRHPKEVIIPNQTYTNARGYVFNRQNSFYTLRTGYMREKILFDKTDKGTVSISLITNGGLSLGLLKPVYVQVSKGGGLGEQITVERYNPEELAGSTVYGEANFFKGIGETKLYPGIYAKVGANFEYHLIEKKVISLEAGVIYDYFFREVPIFYETPGGEDINFSGFFQMYIAFNIGYRKN